jgi:hypothetical protein
VTEDVAQAALSKPQSERRSISIAAQKFLVRTLGVDAPLSDCWPRCPDIFSDLIGKLDALHVSCDKCGRDGCYGLRGRKPTSLTTALPR